MEVKIILMYVLLGLGSYLLCGVNPAIVLSKLLYKQDIREVGSKNPGFTNFKRVYGKTGWLVFILDILKGIIVGVVALALANTMKDEITNLDFVKLTVAYCGLMGVIGHSYPVWYKFSGGKGFLVSATIIFFIDYRIGIICFLTMLILLLTVKYMSLSTMVAMLLGPILIILFNLNNVMAVLPCAIVNLAQVILMCYRHKKNIIRLIKKEEPKFSFSSKK